MKFKSKTNIITRTLNEKIIVWKSLRNMLSRTNLARMMTITYIYIFGGDHQILQRCKIGKNRLVYLFLIFSSRDNMSASLKEYVSHKLLNIRRRIANIPKGYNSFREKP